MQQPVEAIWHEFSASLRGFILKRVGDEQTAEDILQEVFVKIHLHLDALNDDAKLESWIYQITRNAIADHYRRTWHAPVPLDELQVADENGDEAFRAALAASVQDMIDCLPEEYRTALVLDSLEGIPQARIAAQLGISVSGAKSRVQRARAKLRDLLWECCHFEFDRVGKVIDYHPRSQCCPRCGSAPDACCAG
jgi:RNA polymerase sigma-70 factor (ECF subfamily)